MVKCFNPDVLAVGQSLKAANSCFPKPELRASGVWISVAVVLSQTHVFFSFRGASEPLMTVWEWVESLWPFVACCDPLQVWRRLVSRVTFWAVLKWEYSIYGCVGAVPGGEQWLKRESSVWPKHLLNFSPTHNFLALFTKNWTKPDKLDSRADWLNLAPLPPPKNVNQFVTVWI